MKVSVNDEEWELTDFFCSHCGRQEVWRYRYRCLCMSCNSVLSGPFIRDADNYKDYQRLASIKAAIVEEEPFELQDNAAIVEKMGGPIDTK